MVRTLLASALALVFIGCGETGGGANMMTAPDMTPAGPDLAPYDPGPYPEDNIGVDVGDTLYNVFGKGYKLTLEQTDVSEIDLIDKLSIDDAIRRNPKCNCLLVSQAALWCGPCRKEQEELVPFLDSDPTFCAFNVVLEDEVVGNPADEKDLVTWNNDFHQNFPIIVASHLTKVRLPDTKSIPRNTLINPKTMKILRKDYGLQPLEDYRKMCDEENAK